MVIWLASYPRSGNTWVRILLNRLYGVKTYSDDNDLLFESIGVSDVVGYEVLQLSLDDLDDDDAVHFVKTHGLPKDGRPAIYLVRDGRDALVSFARFRLSFSREKPAARVRRDPTSSGEARFQETLRNLIVSGGDQGGWSNHVLSWTSRRQAGLTFTIRYEDLILDPVGWVEKSLADLAVELPPVGGALPSFEELHRTRPDFFRKGVVGAWRDEMPADLHALFWEHHAEAMDAFGYRRDDDAPEDGQET